MLVRFGNASNPMVNLTNVTSSLHVPKKPNRKVIKTLEISSVSGAHNGQITCIAENIVGKTKASSILRINCKYTHSSD